jgi:hypothetical protein
MAIQRLAQDAASAGKQEAGYDFTSFYGVKKKFDEHNTIAVISVANGRVVGLVVSVEGKCSCSVDLTSFQADHFGSWRPTSGTEVEPHRRRVIGMIWVLKAKRRQGVAQGFIKALAEHCNMKIEDIAHMLPFTEDAVRLWIGFKLSTIYVAV